MFKRFGWLVLVCGSGVFGPFPHSELITHNPLRYTVCLSQVVLVGMDILSALVSRLQDRFRTQVGTGESFTQVGHSIENKQTNK